MPKLLATVFISPTPNADEILATQIAAPPTVIVEQVLPTPVPTAYIGVFIGEAESPAEGPIINPQLLGNPPTPAGTTIDLSGCATQPDALFTALLTSDGAVAERLRCPIEVLFPFDGTLQVFERGVMYWRPTGEIWAVAPREGRYWYVPSAPPVTAGEISAPDGLRAPVLGFGAVWRGIDGVQAALGFARTDETKAQLGVQRFEGGALLADQSSGQTFVLYADSTLAGPY